MRTPKRYHALAVAPSQLAELLNIRRAEVVADIASGALETYKCGIRKRIFVRDALQFYKRKWRRI